MTCILRYFTASSEIHTFPPITSSSSSSPSLLLPHLLLSLSLSATFLPPFPSLAKFLLTISAMPDLGNLSLSSALTLSHCSSDVPDAPVKTLPNAFASDPAFEPRVLKRTRGSLDRVKKPASHKAFLDRLKDPFSHPYLVGAPKMVFLFTIFSIFFSN